MPGNRQPPREGNHRDDSADALIDRVRALLQRAQQEQEHDPEAAQALNEEAYQLSQQGALSERPFQAGMIESLRNLAELNLRNGLYDTAMAQTYEALSLLDGKDPNAEMAQILHILGQVFFQLGNFPEALNYLLKGLNIVELLGLPQEEVKLLTTVGMIYFESGDVDQSQTMFYRALRILRELGERKQEVQVLNRLALALHARGDIQQANQRARRALQIAVEIPSETLKSLSLMTIGKLEVDRGNPEEGVKQLQRALKIAKKKQLRAHIVEIKRHIGKGYALQGKNKEALNMLHAAIAVAEEIDARVEYYRSQQLLAAVLEATGDYEHALEHYKLFHAAKEEIFNQVADQRLASLKVIHQVEQVKKDVEIYLLRNVALQQEVEERIRANEALQELAITDPLTDLFNRRHFFYLAEQKFLNARERSLPLSIVMADVDHFKEVNDTFGHVLGDSVLKHIAGEIKDDLRDSDIPARYGGDEFVILLPLTPYEHALEVARRVQKRIQSTPFQDEEHTIPLSLSLGVASLEETSASLEDVLQTADQALYCAKRNNKTTVP